MSGREEGMGREGWVGEDKERSTACAQVQELPMMPPGADVLHCLLSWLEQNDGAAAESEAGRVTPGLEECVCVAKERKKTKHWYCFL